MLKKIYLEEYNSYVYVNESEVIAIINGRIYLKNGNSIKLEVSKPLYDINQPINPVYVPIRYPYPYQTIPIYSPYFRNQYDKSTFNPLL